MSAKPKTIAEMLDNITQVLVDDILSMTDEEILEECRQMGVDPHAYAADMREKLNVIIRRYEDATCDKPGTPEGTDGDCSTAHPGTGEDTRIDHAT